MFILLLSIASLASFVHGQCEPSITTAGGPMAPKEICSGQLIFEDNFQKLDLNKWRFDRTMWGGGNGEFQWYDAHPENAYIEDEALWIRPTFTCDYLGGEEFLYNSTITIPEYECTESLFNGCSKTGTPERILPPLRSAALRTIDSFWFTYGKVEFRARIPTGDWLWPALWMLPKFNEYGPWPYSGEIDVMESRGNQNLSVDGTQIGVEQVGQTIHYPFTYTAHFTNEEARFDQEYHTYGVEWVPTGMRFFIDGLETTFTSYGRPFNKDFYILMNLAVGGTGGYFPEEAVNENGRSWRNDENGMTMFWQWRKETWLPTWNLEDDKKISFAIDYVKVWAL